MFLLLAIICTFSTGSLGQFPVTDGVNDLFAILTQCPISPNTPPENQYYCYRTNMQMVFGFTVCDPVFVRQRNVSIGSKTQNYTVYFLNTPGRLRGGNYVNRLLCKWNVKCPPGQLMYYDVPDHNIENPVTSPFFTQNVCLDFLQISRDFGDEVTCGGVPPQNDLEPSRLVVQFRSNKVNRRPGFRMRIVCFDPKSHESEGCTTSNTKRDVKQEKSYEEMMAESQKIKQILSGVNRQKRNPSSRIEQEEIPREAIVVYEGTTLTVINTKTYKVLFVYNGITSLHTYNEFDGVKSFYRITKRIKFRGFGVLIVIEKTSYYIIFGVENRFLPNQKQKQTISMLLDAEEALIVDDDFIIPEEQSTPAPQPNDKKRDTHSRRKRQTASISPSAIGTAQANRNSCNAILKAVAESVLKNA